MDAAIAILEGLNDQPIVERGPIAPPATDNSPAMTYAVTVLLGFAAGYWVSSRMAKRSSALSDYF